MFKYYIKNFEGAGKNLLPPPPAISFAHTFFPLPKTKKNQLDYLTKMDLVVKSKKV